jgi:hypothetical protein
MGVLKKFEVAIGNEVHSVINGVERVLVAGEHFFAHEIGKSEDWVEKEFEGAVKVIDAETRKDIHDIAATVVKVATQIEAANVPIETPTDPVA